MAAQPKWSLSGDYFENCNCDVVCPCLVSSAAPLTARPSQGVCDVALVFHIDKGSYDQVSLDGLNIAVVGHTPGPMADRNWTLGAYIDERADDQQTAALGAIFGGAEGGPMAAFAPLVGQHLGAKKVPIKYVVNGKTRSVRRQQWRARPCPRLPGRGSWRWFLAAPGRGSRRATRPAPISPSTRLPSAAATQPSPRCAENRPRPPSPAARSEPICPRP